MLKSFAFFISVENEKSKQTIKNDPRECIRADNILKQNVTRYPRVPPSPRLGVRLRRGLPYPTRGATVIVDCGVVTPRTF